MNIDEIKEIKEVLACEKSKKSDFKEALEHCVRLAESRLEVAGSDVADEVAILKECWRRERSYVARQYLKSIGQLYGG